MIVGYPSGIYDMFHIGYLNILRCAKDLCDYLIAGIVLYSIDGFYARLRCTPTCDSFCCKFKQLLDTGTITQKAFDAKKKQLLGL